MDERARRQWGGGQVPRDRADGGADLPGHGPSDLGSLGLTPQELAGSILAEADQYAEITVDGTAKVAGQSAYQVLVEPREDAAGRGGVDSVRISVDAETGVPLAVTVHSEGRQLFDVAFSQIRYERPSGGNFDFTPPQGAEVIDLAKENPFGDFGLGSGLGSGLLGQGHR